MEVMVLDTTAFTICAQAPTLEQALYVADIVVPKNHNDHICDASLGSLACFTNNELADFYQNTENSVLDDSKKRDRELLEGLVLHTAGLKRDVRETGALYAVLKRLPRTITPLPGREPKTANTPSNSGTNSGGGARASGSKQLIFGLANDAWAEAGKPTDVKEILKLRKQWMDKWEVELGIKRTTASSTLGAWQKELFS